MTKPEIPDLDLLVRPPDYKGQVVRMSENHNRRVLSATIWDYEYLGWHIYDAEIWFVCADCGASSQKQLPSASLEEIAEICSYAGTNLHLGYVKDPARFLYDVEDGAWNERGIWVEYPDYQWMIQQAEELEAKLQTTKKVRRESQTIKLSMWFVEHILHEMDETRVWNKDDFSSAITKHATDLLKRHSVRDICGCCEAVRDDVIGDGICDFFKRMIMIETSGEPPLISQWRAYLQEPPAIYMESQYADWIARSERTYAEVLVEALPVAEPSAAVDLDNPKTKKPRARKNKHVKAEQLDLM